MYGSYVEFLATLNSTPLPQDENIGILPQLRQSIETACQPEHEDFIVVAEFCETLGPVPVFTIPNEVRTDIDVNKCVMEIFSSDHQKSPNGKFKLAKDVQVFLSDDELNTHVYGHYFMLCDINGRGCARLMCMAFVSHDRKKIIDNFSTLKSNFNEVSRIIKHANMYLFKSDIENYILHDKETMKGKHFPMRDEKTKECMTKSEANDILRTLKKASLENSRNEYDLDALLHATRKTALKTVALDALCQLWPYYADCIKRNGTKNIFDLALWGTIVAICLLLRIQRMFKQSNISLMIDKEDMMMNDPVTGTLCINDTVLFNIFYDDCKRKKLTKTSPCAMLEPSEYSAWFAEYFPVAIYSSELRHLFFPVLNRRLSLDLKSSFSEQMFEEFGLLSKETAESAFELCQTCVKRNHCDFHPPPSSIKNTCNRKRQSFLNIANLLTPDKPGHGLVTSVFGKYSCFPHLMYSLLTGRSVIIAGYRSAEEKIRNIVQALALFVPEKSGRQGIIPWANNVDFTVHDFITLKLIGMSCNQLKKLPNGVQNYCCILDISEKIYKGPFYKGKILSELKYFPCYQMSDSLLAIQIFCMLITVDVHVQNLYNDASLQSSTASSMSHMYNSCRLDFKESELADQDLNIIKYFVHLLRRKQMEFSQINDAVDAGLERLSPCLLFHEDVSVLRQ